MAKFIEIDTPRRVYHSGDAMEFDDTDTEPALINADSIVYVIADEEHPGCCLIYQKACDWPTDASELAQLTSVQSNVIVAVEEYGDLCDRLLGDK